MKSGTMVVTGSATVVIPLEYCPASHMAKFVRWWKKMHKHHHCGPPDSPCDYVDSMVVHNPTPEIRWGLQIRWSVEGPRKIFWAISDIPASHLYKSK